LKKRRKNSGPSQNPSLGKSQPQHGTFFLVDIEGFNRDEWSDLHRTKMRTTLQDLLAQQAKACFGSRRFATLDIGDAVGLIFPATITKYDVFTKFSLGFERILPVHNQGREIKDHFRLRAVLHFGDYFLDKPSLSKRGYTGKEINIAFRLLDSQELREHLKVQTDANPMALLVSDDFFFKIIKQQAPSYQKMFAAIDVTAKDGMLGAWMYIRSVLSKEDSDITLESKKDQTQLSANSSPKSRDIEDRRRRVVITGMGVISPSGNDLASLWKNVRNGISAVAPITHFDASGFPVRIAAEVREFDVSKFNTHYKLGRFDRSVQYSVAAATLAVEDAAVRLSDMDSYRIGVVEGAQYSGMESIVKVCDSYLNSGRTFRALHPYNILSCYSGEGSGMISLCLGIRGHCMTYCSGSASGNDAVGYARRIIQSGDLDLVVAGGSGHNMELLHAGLCRLRAMSECNENPVAAMRPFDRTRDGFVIGEGAAFLVLEELSHALLRGAHIYAEIIGHGHCSDSYHMTDPHPEGLGFIESIRCSLNDAQIRTTDVQYINSHGSATPLNDPIETRAIKRVFGEHARHLSISATKPITGHMMGASGAIETIICALAITWGEIPPTINLRDADETCDLDYVPLMARQRAVEVALNLNAGFGGRYACLVLRRFMKLQ
jgi:3-oxoacyl-[acyl-carrier-protein] synthase II